MLEALTEVFRTTPSPLELRGGRRGVLLAPKPVRVAAVRDLRHAGRLLPNGVAAVSPGRPGRLLARERMDRVGDPCTGTEARLRLELALQSYQRRTGTFPGTLQELQGLPDTVWQDPFTDRPCRYQRTRTGYRLYACSRDGVDHGGDPTRDLLAGTLVNWR